MKEEGKGERGKRNKERGKKKEQGRRGKGKRKG